MQNSRCACEGHEGGVKMKDYRVIVVRICKACGYEAEADEVHEHYGAPAETELRTFVLPAAKATKERDGQS